jgi:Protein of unknown function (DUF664)
LVPRRRCRGTDRVPGRRGPGWLVRPDVPAADVFGLYREEIAGANAIIAATPLDALARRHDPRWDAWGWPAPGETVNLRWIVLHMIEETAGTPGTSTPRASFSTAAPAWVDRSDTESPDALARTVDLSSLTSC